MCKWLKGYLETQEEAGFNRSLYYVEQNNRIMEYWKKNKIGGQRGLYKQLALTNRFTTLGNFQFIGCVEGCKLEWN